MDNNENMLRNFTPGTRGARHAKSMFNGVGGAAVQGSAPWFKRYRNNARIIAKNTGVNNSITNCIVIDWLSAKVAKVKGYAWLYAHQSNHLTDPTVNGFRGDCSIMLIIQGY